VNASESVPRRARVPQWAWATLAALMSGALMSTCYWPLNLHVLGWVALVPWLVVLPRLGAGRAWLFGTLVGLAFYRIGLAWLCTLAGPLGAAVVVVLAVWMGFSFRVAKLLMDRFSMWAMVWAVPFTFVGQEVLRCEGLPGYRLGFLAWGYSQSHNLWIAQTASIGGVYCISFLLITFNSALAYALIRRRARNWALVGAIAALVILLAYASQPSRNRSEKQVFVACVQSETSFYPDYIDLTREALSHADKPDFVVLPEHAIYDYASEEHLLVKALADLASKHHAYICVGAHVRAKRGAQCDFDNVGLLIGPQGRIVGRQAKAIPIPFFHDGNPAESQEIIDTPYGRTGTYVCYDATFTDVPRRLVDMGAELLLGPVMDAEEWPAQERWQHADMAPLRSIELRRCAVRAASSGISQIIDACGRIRRQRTREEGPGIICGPAYFSSERTLFLRGGYRFANAVGLAYLAAIVGLTLADWWKKVARVRRSASHAGDGPASAARRQTTECSTGE
jgi:apolipoprotein N-acyltransferase